MIAKTFDYIAPQTREEAVQAYAQCCAQGKTPLYYAGGSEIITMAQAGSIAPEAVIDLKPIASLRGIRTGVGGLCIGANTTLSQISESGAFPLLGCTAARIADHTNQVRITLGGNLCGTIMYREAALPLLLADARLLFFSQQGERTAAMHDAFDGRIQRAPDEILCQIRIAPAILRAPFVHVKRTGGEKIAYPLVTVAAARVEGRMRLAASGLCPFPFRARQMEETMNDPQTPARERAVQMAEQAPAPVVNDEAASDGFRKKAFIDAALEAIEALEEKEA